MVMTPSLHYDYLVSAFSYNVQIKSSIIEYYFGRGEHIFYALKDQHRTHRLTPCYETLGHFDYSEDNRYDRQSCTKWRCTGHFAGRFLRRDYLDGRVMTQKIFETDFDDFDNVF